MQQLHRSTRKQVHAHMASDEEIKQSTSGVMFIHTIGLMPETVNDLIEQGRCVREQISPMQMSSSRAVTVEEERIPVLYLNPNESDSSLYLLENAREVVPADVTVRCVA